MARRLTGRESPTENRARLRRLSRADWVDAATEVLAAHGLAAVAVEPIAERLGVTKGSFYSHFSSRDDLVEAVLERWKAQDTTQVLAWLDQISEPRERLVRFVELAFERHHWGRVFAALCASATDPRVDPTMTDVRKARLAYLKEALRQLGLSRQEAHDQATLLYASYVGFWRLVAVDPNWEYNDARHLHRMAARVTATLIPAGAGPETPAPRRGVVRPVRGEEDGEGS
jgi:AcrR family transcriptional regulator